MVVESPVWIIILMIYDRVSGYLGIWVICSSPGFKCLNQWLASLVIKWIQAPSKPFKLKRVPKSIRMFLSSTALVAIRIHQDQKHSCLSVLVSLDMRRLPAAASNATYQPTANGKPACQPVPSEQRTGRRNSKCFNPLDRSSIICVNTVFIANRCSWCNRCCV